MKIKLSFYRAFFLFLFHFPMNYAHCSAWTKEADPSRFVAAWNLNTVENRLQLLPTEGALPIVETPWPSSYIPMRQNGFFYRANFFQSQSLDFSSGNFQKFFNLKRPQSFAEFLGMSQFEKDSLSPFEKFSIIEGDFNYRIEKLFHQSSEKDPYWAGYCHAWATAALQYEEPKPVDFKLGDAHLAFTSADVKALLIANTDLKLKSLDANAENVLTIGNRCDKKIVVSDLRRSAAVADFTPGIGSKNLSEKDLQSYLKSYQTVRRTRGFNDLSNAGIRKALQTTRSTQCSGVNAGAFHIILTNQLGIRKKGFVMDIARDVEVWNQPVYRYSSEIKDVEIPPSQSARGVSRLVKVKTTLWYADDTFYGWSFSEPILTPFLNHQALSPQLEKEYTQYQSLLVSTGKRKAPGQYPDDLLESVDYEYLLELGEQNQIIGGEWLTYDRPDFMWVSQKMDLDPVFARLKDLLN